MPSIVKPLFAALMITALLLTGCSSDTEAPTTSLSSESPELALLREQAPFFDSVSEEMIEETAVAVCDGFDSGLTLEQVAVALNAEGRGIPYGAAGSLVAYAIYTECPEHEGQITGSSI